MNNVKLSSIRVPAIDGLRGIAIAMVLLHMLRVPQPTGVSNVIVDVWLGSVATAGWAGVQLFFVLSGYLITGQLLDSKTAPNYFSGFFVRRILRIFPLYYGMLILAFVVRPLFTLKPDSLNDTAHNQIWLWTFLYNWAHPFGHYVAGFTHFWSLAVEEQFYIFWPLVVWRRSPKQVLNICVALIVVALLVRIAMRAGGVAPLVTYVYTVCRMDALAAGAAVAAIVRLSDPAQGLARRNSWPLSSAIGCMVIGAALLPFFDQNSLVMQTVGMSLLSIGFAAVVYLVWNPVSAPKLLTAILSSRILKVLGKYSYGIYVFHLPLSYFLLDRLAVYLPGGQSGFLPVIYFFCATAVTLGLAMVSFHLYENPILNLKKRFASLTSASSDESGRLSNS